VNRRTVAVVTGTRAEFGLLTPILKEIRSDRRFRLQIIAAGQHFVANRGSTWKEIPKAGFRIDAEVRAPEPTRSPAWMGEALGVMTAGFSRLFAIQRPDWLLVLGDRAEPLAAALAATEMGGIAIAHLHGGEVTGHRQDDQRRWLLSALAHLHLAATSRSVQLLQNSGEDLRLRIRQVGAPGLDSILERQEERRPELCRQYGLPETGHFLLLAQHAVPHQAAQAKRQIQETLKALRRVGLPTLAFAPSTDRGGAAILRELKKASMPKFHLVASVPHRDYLGLLSKASALVGNSSSGIIEAPAFGTPAVDIGIRQAGRERSAHVIPAPHRAASIESAIRKALSQAFRNRIERSRSPYGDGKTTPKVVKLLASVRIDDRFLEKTHD